MEIRTSLGFKSLFYDKLTCFVLSHSSVPGLEFTKIWRIFQVQNKKQIVANTIRPKSSDPFYIVTYYINWVTTSWTHSMVKINDTA